VDMETNEGEWTRKIENRTWKKLCMDYSRH